jgi:hypothetical protein
MNGWTDGHQTPMMPRTATWQVWAGGEGGWTLASSADFNFKEGGVGVCETQLQHAYHATEPTIGKP